MRLATLSVVSMVLLVSACGGSDESGNPATGGAAPGGAAATGGKGSSGSMGGGSVVGGSTSIPGTSTAAGTTSMAGNSGTAGSTNAGGSMPLGGSSASGGLNGGAGSSALGGASAGASSTGGTSGVVTSGTGGVGGVTSQGGSTATGGTSTIASGGTAGGSSDTGGALTGGTSQGPDGTSTGGSSTATSGGVGGIGTVAGGTSGGNAGSGGTTSTTCASGITDSEGRCWTCDPKYFNAGDAQCDCGCGATDSDCSDKSNYSCTTDLLPGSCVPLTTGFPYSAINPGDNALCVQAPVDWTCPYSSYGEGNAFNCDCGCGVVDLDCASADATECQLVPFGSCAQNDDSSFILSTDNSKCDFGNPQPPSGWTCSIAAFNDGTCDWGCGAPDSSADCATSMPIRCGTLGACSYYPSMDEPDCTQLIDPNDTSKCQAGLWTCNPDARGDGFCDCGCGIPDTVSDCFGLSDLAGCTTCRSSGSCAASCQDIDPANLGVCNTI